MDFEKKKNIELEVLAQIQLKKEERELSEILEKQQTVCYFERYANSMCREAANRGNIAEAELWIRKLAKDGRVPETQSFNGVLKAKIRSGELEQAEQWFENALNPILHPELRGIQPDAWSYNAMVECFASKKDLPKAEKYAEDAKEANAKLQQHVFTLLIDACLSLGEVKRAHNWMDAMVRAGFGKPNKEIMRRLVRGLADLGSVESAERWLAYMTDIGLVLDAETFAHVRAACPMEVLPCKLSMESDQTSPAQVRPIKLKGEEALDTCEMRPKRDAHKFMPSRSARASTPKWSSRLVVEVQQEATKNLPAALKAQFLTTPLGKEVGAEQGDLALSPRIPRRRYLGPGNHYLQFSRVASATMPPRPEVTSVTVGDPQWHPYWLDSGPPPQPLQRLQFGGV